MPPDDPASLETLGSVYLRARDVQTIAIRGEANYSKGTDRWFFRFELIARKPDTFLFTILDPVGAPSYRIFVDSSRLSALDYRQRIFYRGPAPEHPLEDFLPLPLTAPDFLALLSGLIPSEPVSARAETTPSPEARTAVFVYSDAVPGGSGVWRAQLEGGPGYLPEDAPRLLTLSRGPRNSPDFTVRYDRRGEHLREDTGAMVSFPEALRASWRGNPSLSIRAEYTEIRLGFVVPEGVFTLGQPPGFSLQLL